MSAAQTPFGFAGTLQLAPDPTLPQDGIPFNFSGQYVALAEALANLTGSGTFTVPFASVGAPGAKGVLVRYDPGQTGAAPVLCTINSGSAPLEISPGGFFVLFNPNPAAGITAMSIAYTAACQLRIWVLG